jgi:4-azaleucine resistance transporter AzlC
MKSLTFAIKQIVPLVCSYVFVGLAYGMLIDEAGYPFVWAPLSAMLIYAGSMQIVMLTLMTSGMPLYMIAVMTLFINGRHLFYGLGFIDEFREIGKQKRSFWKYPYMALTMTDETFSIFCSLKYPDDTDRQKVEFYILFLSHMLWILSCILGAVIGRILPVDMAGIEFSATAFFTAVVVNQWREFKSHIPVITGFVSAVLCYFLLGPDNFILPALSVSVILLVILRDRVQIRMLEGSHE